jgi:hypothetical protein
MSVDNNIPNAWVETTLGEVCDVRSGGTPFCSSMDWGIVISMLFIKEADASLKVEPEDNFSIWSAFNLSK